MLIKIDSRETSEKLFDAFDILASEKLFDYEKTYLEVGDIACGNVVIERKEAVDFIGSIMDGRLREQAAKMCLNYKHRYIIIEGNPFRTSSTMHQNAIIGKMTSLMVKHDIKLLFVEDCVQLAYACFSIIKKHEENKTFDPAEFVKLSYKIKNEDIVTAMILQIPGLGIDKAKTISAIYGDNLRRFVLEADIKILKGIDGIGDIMAKKIMELVK